MENKQITEMKILTILEKVGKFQLAVFDTENAFVCYILHFTCSTPKATPLSDREIVCHST